MKKLFIIILLVTMVTSACRKYPEGSEFTLQTRDSRINGQWEVTKLFVNNADSTALFIASGAAQYDYSFWVGGYQVYGNGDNPFFSFTGTGTASNGDEVNPNGTVCSAGFNLNAEDTQISFACLPSSIINTYAPPPYYPYYPIISTQTITWNILLLSASEMWLQTSYSNGKKYELRLNKIGSAYCGGLEH